MFWSTIRWFSLSFSGPVGLGGDLQEGFYHPIYLSGDREARVGWSWVIALLQDGIRFL